MFSRHIYILQVFLLCFCISVFSLVLFVPHAFAAATTHKDNPMSITAQAVTATFPKGIDFQISLQDTGGNISEATLILSSSKPRYIHVDRNVTIYTPQATEVLRWHEDTTGDNFVFPGTVIEYTWRLRDSNGNTFAPESHSLTVVDNRFTWQQLTQSRVNVHWYGQPTDFGQVVLSQAINNIRRISDNLGGVLIHPINLWIYQTPDDFRGALPPDVHEWVGGIAFPPLNEASIVVDSVNADTLIRDMPHELTHLVFHQLTEHGILAPLWFDEGMAVYNQTYHEPEMKRILNHALTTHKLLRLSTLAYNFPADSDAAYLAYAQSWNIISYMYSTFGQAKMAKLITLMQGTHGEFQQDVQQALGEDQVHLENQWRLQLNQPAVLTPADMAQATPQSASGASSPVNATDPNAPLLLFVGMLLILLPVGGFASVLVYQRRKQQRILIQQQAQNIMNATSVPYGQPYQLYSNHYRQPVPPFGSQGTMPPQPYIDSTTDYANPTWYTSSQEQPPQSSMPGRGYTEFEPSKQAPQE